MGLLSRRSPRELMARRGGAIVAVVALHVLAVSTLLHMRYNARPEPESAVIRVANFQMNQRNDEPAPELEVQLVEPPEFEVVVPLVSIHLDVPPPSAITPPPPPPRAAQAQPVVAREAAPLMLDASEVDYATEPRPVYPRAAKQARVQGTVLLWVLVDPEGRPREVRVHRSSGSEQLDRAGREAVLDCRFKPYRRDGVALSVQVLVPIGFTIATRTAQRG